MIATCNYRSLLTKHGALGLRLDAAPARPLGGRLFRKEVARVGEWVHPDTGELVSFSHDDLAAIAEETNRWIAAQGGRIPFPDGHRFDAGANLGFWLSLALEGDQLYGVVEAGTDEVAGKLGTTIRDVSIYLEGETKDSHGAAYRGVVTHIAATSFPVIEGQTNFIQLSRGAAAEAVRIPLLRLASAPEGRRMSVLKGIAGDLGLSTDGLDEAALEAEIRKKLKSITDEREAAAQQSAKASQALSAKDGEVVSLGSRLAHLEKEIDTREKADCDREIKEVKALAAQRGRPEALDQSREKFIRERWRRDREAARQTLALARDLAMAAAPAKLAETTVVKPIDKEAIALARASAIEAAKKEARAMGWQTRMDGERLIAFKPGEKSEVVLVH